jgi:hypothetical protein
MPRTSVVFLAVAMFGGSLIPASAQGVDCTTAVDAIDYYCNHRDQFDKPAATAAPVAAPMATGAVTSVPRRTSHGARHATHPTRHRMTHSG